MMARPDLTRLSTRVALTLTAAIVAGAALGGPAYAAAPKLGVYDCEGTATFSYVNSIKLMSGGRYLVGSERVGKKLKRTTRGRYRVSGKKIKWLSGMYKRLGYSSTIYKGYFSIDRADGTSTGVSCTYLPKPTGARAPGI